MTDIASKPIQSERSKFFRRLLKRRTVAFGVLILAIFVLLAVLAPWIAPYSPSKLSIVNRLKPPSGTFFFGTDEFGRDIFSRTIYAGRLSLLVGVAVVTLSAVIGVTLGLLAGFFKKLDAPIARLIDAMMAFPDILLAIALVA
ncbi:ABC transporter permease, partial [Rhizobium sp. P32RR-XVIII]|nr:ABC transporter permease [Rhizobium sp. P32RR-XVIII]